MSRYIDANKLKKSLSIPCASIIEIGETIIAQIDDQPTADVVEVVRCNDCKWWDNEDDAERCTHKYCSMWAKPDGYCIYGERAEA